MSLKTRRILIGVAGTATLIMAFVLVLSAIFFNGAPGAVADRAPTPTRSISPKPSPSPTPCASSWPISTEGNGTAKWLSEGVPSIKTADTNAKAKAAADDWVKGGQSNIYTLAGMAQYILQQSVDPLTLRGQDGCATGAAVQIVTQIKLVLANAPIVPSTAPSNGYNSARDTNGVVVGATKSGVSGDETARKAIQITLPDGSALWVMARCGNAVTSSPPTRVPSCAQEGNCSPKTCEQLNGGLECKNPSQDPVNQGNAPRGGGKNQDPGAGTYQPPATVTRPPATYTPPAPPPPAPAGNTGGGSGGSSAPVQDPAPAPSPEPSAPTPDNPAQGCSPPPGSTTC